MSSAATSADLPDQGDDLVELRCEVVELGVGELDPRQSRQMRDLFAGNRWHELIQWFRGMTG